MDISGYMPDGGDGEQVVRKVEKPVKREERKPMQLTSGLQMAAKRVPVQSDVDKAADFVTKRQVYEILRNSYRSNQAVSADIGESGREMFNEYRKRQLESKAIEEQAAMRRSEGRAQMRRA